MIIADIKKILGFMVPIWMTLLVVATMQSISVILAGRVGNIDIAAVSLGVNLWIPLFAALNGIVCASSTIFANLIGAKRYQDLPSVLRHSLYLGVFAGVILIVVANFAVAHIDKVLTLDPTVHDLAKKYIFALSFGAIPMFIATALRQFVEALNSARTVTLVILTALPVDFAISYVLVFGKLGIPAMGGVGAGYGASASSLVMALLLIFLVTKMDKFSKFDIWQAIKWDIQKFKEQLRIGVPIGTAILCEAGMFNMLSFLIVKFGILVVAANQAALTATTFFFMMLLAMSMSMNIVVGYEVGAKNYQAAQRIGRTGLGLCISMSLCTIAFVGLFRHHLAAVFNSDPNTQKLITMYLQYVMFYQLPDAILTTGQGILRAYRDVKAAFYIVITTCWGICIPAGYIADIYLGRGITSYWEGLVFGLFIGAAMILVRIYWLQARYRKLSLVE